jgi:predicted HicB family RNase H-like nuclease
MMRTSTAMHTRLTIEAREQGVSLNQWMVQKLAEPRPTRYDW